MIRYNYFHDILGYGQEHGRWISPHYAWGVYLDDNTGGVDVIGNIVGRCVRGLIHLHNGRDNLIENNIFFDGKLQQMECNGWTKVRAAPGNGSSAHDDQAATSRWKTSPPGRTMRNMDTHPTDAVLPDGKIMSGNKLLPKHHLLPRSRSDAM